MVMRIQPVANHNHMEIIPRTRLNARCQWLQRKQQQKERVDVRTKPWWQQPSSHAVKSSPSKPPRAGSMAAWKRPKRSEEHTSELQSRFDLVCRLLLAKKKLGI